jgi:hypothetical protein
LAFAVRFTTHQLGGLISKALATAAMAPTPALSASILLAAVQLAAVQLAAMPLLGAPGLAAPLPPPPLPELPSAPPLPSDQGSDLPSSSGGTLVINGLAQRAQWRWLGRLDQPPRELWLPLEVLQGQLGFSSRNRSGGGELDLEWFGRRLLVAADRQRPLGDEVAIDVAPLLPSSGLLARASGSSLSLQLAPPQLLGIRPSTAPPGQRRVVLDLSGPAFLRFGEGSLLLGISSRADQLAALTSLGLWGRQEGAALRIASRSGPAASKVFTLGEPNRVVIDLPAGPGPTSPEPASAERASPTRLDRRLQARLGRQIIWERVVRPLGGRQLRLNTVRIDPANTDLELRPLSRPDGMEGLSSLVRLANRQNALVAINGGFFNRVRRLPLGALRDRGRWLSGPILNRGAIGWDPRGLPRFGRLKLEEAVRDSNGNRWPLVVLNSGYVQRGLSRYTADWGPSYRSLSAGESAVVVQEGVVRARYGPDQLGAGVPLTPGAMLLVARAGFNLPWSEGERLSLESRPTTPLGLAANVVGGGPLLLLDGRPVLNGGAEGFSAAFLSQGAPRTVVGSDGRQLWLITLEGIDDDGPTLAETTLLLGQLGLRDALNLDGGSSTGLVMGGLHTVKGRGVVGAVHNGLGLVPSGGEAAANAGS